MVALPVVDAEAHDSPSRKDASVVRPDGSGQIVSAICIDSSRWRLEPYEPTQSSHARRRPSAVGDVENDKD